ncbi:MAG TPA: hypothetical protein VNT75_33180 [Symbiobacteriaceae bacterium]|nr:hypothetical protein [Symbiobacteriaceae bacterium]
MLYPVPPAVSVYGVKVNGLENSSSLAIGPTAFVGGLDSLNKTQQFTEVVGDFGFSPMWYGILTDNDVWDTPMWKAGA